MYGFIQNDATGLVPPGDEDTRLLHMNDVDMESLGCVIVFERSIRSLGSGAFSSATFADEPRDSEIAAESHSWRNISHMGGKQPSLQIPCRRISPSPNTNTCASKNLLIVITCVCVCISPPSTKTAKSANRDRNLDFDSASK